jgi:hypothetical protein
MLPIFLMLMLAALFLASFILLAKHSASVAAGNTKRMCLRIFTCKKQPHEKTDPRELPRWRARIKIAIIRCQQLFFNIVFILYPSICSKIFLVFKCVTYGTKSYLSKDPSVECDTDEHNSYKAWASVFALAYVVGIPAILLASLYSAHKTIKSNPAHPTTYARYKGLYAQYEPNYWWFELVQMMRKMLLTGGLLIMSSGTTQILVGVLVCLAYLLFFVNTNPFIQDDEDKLEQVAAVQLFVSLLLGLVINLRAEVKAASNEVLPPNPELDHLLTAMNTIVIVLGVLTILKSLQFLRTALKEKKKHKKQLKKLKGEQKAAEKQEKLAKKEEQKAKKEAKKQQKAATKKAKKGSKVAPHVESSTSEKGQAVVQPATTAQPGVPPAVQPVVQPPVVQPFVQHVGQPVVQPMMQIQPVVQPMMQMQPVVQPVIQPVALVGPSQGQPGTGQIQT